MKICLIYPHLPPVVDGVGEYTCHLARQLALQGAEVTVLSETVSPELRRAALLPDGVRVDQAIAHWGPRGWPALIRAVRAAGCDVVSLQYAPAFCPGKRRCSGINWLPHVLRARVSCKVSITLHEPWVPFSGGVRRCLMAGRQRLATGWMVGACHRVIVTTERRRRLVQRLMFPSGQNVAMVPVSSNIPLRESDRAATRARLRARDQEVVFALFGTTHLQRSYEVVYRCLRSLLDEDVPCRLVSIGKITDKARVEALRRLEGELDLEGRVFWTGFCEAEEVSVLLSAADLFVMPDYLGASTRQTTLMAALLHGLPVVAWRGPETDPLLECSGALALAEAGDARGLEAAMKAAAIAPEVRACMGARARELFDQHFSWQRVAEGTLKAFRRD